MNDRHAGMRYKLERTAKQRQVDKSGRIFAFITSVFTAFRSNIPRIYERPPNEGIYVAYVVAGTWPIRVDSGRWSLR